MARKSTLYYYKDKKKEWRWRFMATNGKFVADSGEGYKTLRGAEKGWMAVENSIRYLTFKTVIQGEFPHGEKAQGQKEKRHERL